jgi:hypothetical protein
VGFTTHAENRLGLEAIARQGNIENRLAPAAAA